MRRALSIAVLGLAVVGCRGQTSTDAPIVPIRNMFDQPRYDMQGDSAYFADGRAMRPPVDGAISREQEIEPEIATGRSEDGTYVLTIPDAVERAAHIGPARPGGPVVRGKAALLQRGQERYDIFCSPCHSRVGDGQGIIVKRGMQPPPSFHTDRIRHMPDGQVFATISNGIRVMPSYQAQIPVRDRWAIVAYLRALQISQARRAGNP